MRTITLYSLMLGLGLGLGSLVQAQGPAFGVKGGLNMSNLHVDKADNENSRFGFNLGVFGRTDPEQALGLQVELLYSTKGTHTKYEGVLGFVDQDVDFNLNYLEVPVLLAIRLGDVIELQAGGYGAYLLSAKASSSGDLGNSSDELDRENFKAMDFGVVGGVALNLGSAQVGARYNYGLVEVADSDIAQTILGDSKNACLQVYLGIGLGR